MHRGAECYVHKVTDRVGRLTLVKQPITDLNAALTQLAVRQLVARITWIENLPLRLRDLEICNSVICS